MQSTRFAVSLLAVTLLVPALALAAGDWNDAGVDWLPYDEGLEAAAASGKPICLVFYTDWCGHCGNYSRVFHDPGVVAQAKAFVMVRVNKDHDQELSAKFAPDGQYVPRTYFLSSEGRLDPTLQAPRDDFRYFYHENDPASLLGGMQRALARLTAQAQDQCPAPGGSPEPVPASR